LSTFSYEETKNLLTLAVFDFMADTCNNFMPIECNILVLISNTLSKHFLFYVHTSFMNIECG